MNAERLAQIQDVFLAALEHPEEGRAAFLSDACAGDADLRDAVERFLRADEADSSFLDVPMAGLGALDFLDPPLAALPERTIGTYEIERIIGQGGMGIVYLAFDHQLGRPVALKLLPAHLGEDKNAKARLIYEARAAATLDHPHIATIYEVGETKAGHLFVAMPYYGGGTLRQRIDQGAMPVADVVRIGAQVAWGLAAAHERRIIHRDIKPENIVLTSEGMAKILDFGIAKVAGHDTAHPGRRLGTVAYMSPEQARGADVDHRSDLWSLGVVLYEMLTGEHPFRGDTSASILYAIRRQDPPPLPGRARGMSQALCAIVEQLLTKDPRDRYQRASDLAEALEATTSAPSRRAGMPEGLPDNLPESLSSFVGRSGELDEVRALLARSRLVTLTGTGGAGKTRLGLRVAEAEREAFEDGVSFVSLAPLNNPTLVAPAIAQALGLRTKTNVPVQDQLAEFLRDKRGLLVLDNVEQVVEASPLVAGLLSACPGLKVLATSRVPLRIQGEHEYAVPPLSLPQTDDASPEHLLRSEAVALFVQRAQAVRPSFALDEINAPDVAEICTRLDGLPLAIELAAARIKVLSPQVILARLTYRFDLLTGGARDLPSRHRTLREAIAWSYDLLTKDEQKLFRRLAVFVGGHTLEAAEAVGAAPGDLKIEVIDGLGALVDHSLVRQDEERGGELRFSMLETIREFGLECLVASGDEFLIRQAHRDHFLALAEEATLHLTGPNQAEWLDRIERNHDNLRAALNGALEDADEADQAARLGAALWRFWLIRGHLKEGREQLSHALAQPASPALRAKLLTGAGTLAQNQGLCQTAQALYAESLEIFRAEGDTEGTANALNNLGWMGWRLGELDAAEACTEEGLMLHRAHGNRRGEAVALNNLAYVAEYRADYGRAFAHFERALALHRARKDHHGTAFVLTSLGRLLALRGDYDRAEVLLDEALALFRQVGHRQLTAFALSQLGVIIYDSGDADRAVGFLEEQSLPLYRALGDIWGIAFASCALGQLKQDHGAYSRARQLYEESLRLWEETGFVFGVAESRYRMGTLYRVQGDVEQALRFMHHGLRSWYDVGARGYLVEGLRGMAYLALDSHDAERATHLFGAAEALRTALGVVRPLREREAYDEAITFLRSHLGVEAFEEEWSSGLGMTLDEAVAYALDET